MQCQRGARPLGHRARKHNGEIYVAMGLCLEHVALCSFARARSARAP